MTSKKIYGPWIKWHGGECPVPPDTMVEVKLRRGWREKEYPAGGCDWGLNGYDADIMEYRTVTEQAELDAAAKLLHANNYTVIPPTKPLTFEDVVPMTEAPEKGTEYWVASPSAKEGIYKARFVGDVFDDLKIKRRMAYLEKEHALIAARHIFGLKGGEL